MGVAITFAQSGRKNKRAALAAHGISGSETGSGTEGPVRTHHVATHEHSACTPCASASALAGRLRLAAGWRCQHASRPPLACMLFFQKRIQRPKNGWRPHETGATRYRNKSEHCCCQALSASSSRVRAVVVAAAPGIWQVASKLRFFLMTPFQSLFVLVF